MERVMARQNSRTWKGVPAAAAAAASASSRCKGLGEIEEIMVSHKMIQALERFMMAHPAVWSEASVQHLLVEVADSRYISDSMTREHLQLIINRILVPMVKVVETEQEAMRVERQRNHHALEGLKQERDLATKELEEVRTALEETRAAAEESQRKLAARENELHDMAETQRSHRDQVEDKMLVPDECSSSSSNGYNNYRDCSAKPWSSWTLNMLFLVGSEVVRQMKESYDRVKSPLSLPSAMAGFWIGLARRFLYLALSWLVEGSPVQKSHQSHQPVK